jgi:hypothetical protein
LNGAKVFQAGMATKRHEKSQKLMVDLFPKAKRHTIVFFVSFCACSWLLYFSSFCDFASSRLRITSPVSGRLSKPMLRCTDFQE